MGSWYPRIYHQEILGGVISGEGIPKNSVRNPEGRNVTIGEKLDGQFAYINMHTLKCKISVKCIKLLYLHDLRIQSS